MKAEGQTAGAVLCRAGVAGYAAALLLLLVAAGASATTRPEPVGEGRSTAVAAGPEAGGEATERVAAAVEATRRLGAEAPEVGVLVLTMADDDERVFAAIQAGARGYVLKGAGQDEIGHAVWGNDNAGNPPAYDDNMIHRLVYRLKAKVEPAPNEPRYILNVPGSGYRLVRSGRA